MRFISLSINETVPLSTPLSEVQNILINKPVPRQVSHNLHLSQENNTLNLILSVSYTSSIPKTEAKSKQDC